MAGRKKCKCPEGIPEWVVTFGDMMSLLLTFFILLVTFMEMRKPAEFQDMLKAIKIAFGVTPGGGSAPVDDPAFQSVIRQLEDLELNKAKQVAETQTPGPPGPKTTVTKLQEGLRFAIGTPVIFPHGSAVLEADQKKRLDQLAREHLRGLNTKIELRGHADPSEQPSGGGADALWQLSYRRALAVMQYLTTEQKIDPRRLRVVALAATEPVDRRATTEAAPVNRRVEIILTESLMQDFLETPPSGN